MKHLSEQTVQYMNSTWGFDTSGSVDDIAMFWDNAEYEMVALRLVEAGAVNPVCKEAREMIKVAKSVSRAEQDEIIEQCLKDRTILECHACNHVHFIPSWCEPNDWIDGGCEGCNKPNTCKVYERNEK